MDKSKDGACKMSKKGIANIYWLVMAVAVILIVAMAWISASNPVQYTAETGREQSVFFNAYVTAEEIRNYAEESARLSAFQCLQERNISPGTSNCFNITGSVSRDSFALDFTKNLNSYMIEHPLQNAYSETITPTYGDFMWESPPFSPTTENTTSVIYSKNGGSKLAVKGSPEGDIQIINNRYTFLYRASGAINLTVTCKEYENYQHKLEEGEQDLIS